MYRLISEDRIQRLSGSNLAPKLKRIPCEPLISRNGLLVLYFRLGYCASGGVVAVIDPTDIRLDDIVRLRKPHPCGGSEWRVIRLGTDIGIRCLTCGRRVLMPRSQFARRVKAFVRRGGEGPVVSDEWRMTNDG